MNCRIPSVNVRHFTKVITCLTKIGDAINFEISPNRFVLRTLGEGDATYFQIDLEKGKFFDVYNCYYHNDGIINERNIDDQSLRTLTSETTKTSKASKTIKARIHSKVFLSTLRLIDGAKYIELKFDTDVHKLYVIIVMTENRRRKYGIHFEDIPNILQAEFEGDVNDIKEMCCQSNTFKRVLTNFVNSLQEVTLILTDQGLAIKSFIDITDPILANDSIQTEYHLKKDIHFTKFDIELPQNEKQIILTVVQKEFKSFLNLCQALDEPIKIYLTFGGSPICLTNTTPLFWLKHLREKGEHVNDEEYNTTTKGIRLKLIMATISDDTEIEMPRPPNHPSTISATGEQSRQESQHTQLAQNQSIRSQTTTSSSSASSASSSNLMNIDNDNDDDVLIGIPTHNGFGNDNHLDFLQNHEVATTQLVQTTIVNDTEIEDNDTVDTTSTGRSRSNINNINNVNNNHNINNIHQQRKNRYAQFQRHPDSITPPMQKVERNEIVRSRQILPSTSSHDIDSMELQYTVSGTNRNNENRDNGSDYLAESLLNYDEFDKASSLTQTQPIDGGQIADRFRENRKRTMYQNHYNYRNQHGISPKRSKNIQYENTLRKRPKRPFNFNDDDSL